LVITIDARNHDHYWHHGLPPETDLHGVRTSTVEVQELSGVAWPIRYDIITGEGWYVDKQGQRQYVTPEVPGVSLHRKVSDVVLRAGVFLSIIAGVGCRRAAWLLEVLFHVVVSKSALDRWIDEVADGLPPREAIIQELDKRRPITEGHLDELFPRGRNDTCELVLRDEYGRIIATEEIPARDEEHVTPFLLRLKKLGLKIMTLLLGRSRR
jgi:hypothetical protein